MWRRHLPPGDEWPDFIPADARFSHWLSGEYYEINRLRRLVVSGRCVSDERGELFATLIEVTFEACDGGTALTMRQSYVDPLPPAVVCWRRAGLVRAARQLRSTSRCQGTRLTWAGDDSGWRSIQPKDTAASLRRPASGVRQAGSATLRGAFFKKIDKDVPRNLDIHVVLDSLSAHKGPKVAEWLAKPRQKRWHLHYTPTSSSWLNLAAGSSS